MYFMVEILKGVFKITTEQDLVLLYMNMQGRCRSNDLLIKKKLGKVTWVSEWLIKLNNVLLNSDAVSLHS